MADYEARSDKIRNEDLAEYELAFKSYDKDGSGLVEKDELLALFRDLNIRVSKLSMRELNANYGKEVDFAEFKEIVAEYSTAQQGAGFRHVLKKRAHVEKHGSVHGSETTHSYSESEVAAFADWINAQLENATLDNTDDNSKTLKEAGYLPIDSSSKSRDLFVKTGDGVLLCKLINSTVADTIDERVINTAEKKDTFAKHENLTLAINSARSIGCQIVNIGPGDLISGKPHLALGLMWQIIRIGLFSNITLSKVPGLLELLEPGEDPDVLHKMTPEELLLRWVNYHLKAAGSTRRVRNFTEDIKDSEVYSVLLYRVAPEDSEVDNPNTYDSITDDTERAEIVLRNAEKIKCRKFVRSKDIVEGNDKLNLAFVANLFNHYPGLTKQVEKKHYEYDNPEETREEKTYRNWMNSLGVNPFVTWLYTDLRDGHVLFQLFDLIQPNIVNKCKTTNREKCANKLGGKYAMIGNCSYVVTVGEELGLQLKTVSGENIYHGDETATKGLMWQMLRAYTMSILSGLGSDEDGSVVDEMYIFNWVQNELKKGGKKPLNGKDFKSSGSSISTSLPVIDLVDVISKKYFRYNSVTSDKRSIVKYELVKDGNTEEDKKLNAKYALSLARKIGAQIYALPEDLVEVNPKMVVTIFACLKVCASKKEKERPAAQVSRKTGRKF